MHFYGVFLCSGLCFFPKNAHLSARDAWWGLATGKKIPYFSSCGGNVTSPVYLQAAVEYLTTNAPKNRLRVQQVVTQNSYFFRDLLWFSASHQRVHEVTLPKLFKWYKDDFGFSKQARQQFFLSCPASIWRQYLCCPCISIPNRQEILAYYASFMPPGMREEQTEVRISDFLVLEFRVILYCMNLVGEEQQLRYQVREIWLESASDQGLKTECSSRNLFFWQVIISNRLAPKHRANQLVSLSPTLLLAQRGSSLVYVAGVPQLNFNSAQEDRIYPRARSGSLRSQSSFHSIASWGLFRFPNLHIRHGSLLILFLSQVGGGAQNSISQKVVKSTNNFVCSQGLPSISSHHAELWIRQ